MFGTSRKFLLTACALTLALISLLLLAAGCGEEEKKATLDPTTIGEYNKPGIVLVETTWTADVTVPDIDFDVDALIAYFEGLIAAGQLPADTTEAELLDLMVQELVLNPQYYVYATVNDRETSMESSVYGTGFIVTEDGYALTNAHVVKKSEDDLRLQMAYQAGGEFLTADLNRFEEYIGIDLSEEYENIFLETTASLYDQYMTVSSPKSDSQMYMVNVDGKLSDPIDCELVEVGDPIDIMDESGKDVAVIKVNQKNLPTVAVGDDSDLKDGEQAIALGYPSVATFDPNFDLTNIDPTLTQGTISSQKTMEGGWKVIQTDATISGGSSGSPLFNSKGEAIGINTFGATELNEQTGEAETQPGYNYAIPATVAREFLDKANVDAQLGPLTVKYHEAVDLYEDEHYQAAKEKFQAIDEANSDYPYVDEYIENSTGKINDGLDKPTSSVPSWLWIVLIAAGVVLVLGGGGFLVMKSRGKKQAAATAGVSATVGAAVATEPEPVAQPEPAIEPEPAAEAEATPVTPTEEMPPAAEPADETPAGETASEETEAAGGQQFCAKCGNELDLEDEFCSKCGEHRK